MDKKELQECICGVDKLLDKQTKALTLIRKELIPNRHWDSLISALENIVIAIDILKTSVILIKESEDN